MTTIVQEKEVVSAEELDLLIQNMSQAIIDRHPDLENIVLVGILSAGYPLAVRLKKGVQKLSDAALPVGKLDVSLYRDDLLTRGKFVTMRESDIPFDLNGKTLILVDDVLFHGRTIRAALNGLLDFGRPAKIELAVLVDRGHIELPIFAHVIGKTVPTLITDHIKVNLIEIDGEDKVSLLKAVKKLDD